MEKNDFERIKTAVVSRLKKMPDIKAVYLFGSYATGKEKPISDIDLCVITEKGIRQSKKLEILSCAGRNVEISMFHDLPIALKAKVFREGMLLFCRDNRLLIDIKIAVMKEYLDFKPVLDRFTRVYAGA